MKKLEILKVLLFLICEEVRDIDYKFLKNVACLLGDVVFLGSVLILSKVFFVCGTSVLNNRLHCI